jgi:hypothetical protein
MQVSKMMSGSRMGFSGGEDSSGDIYETKRQIENKMAANMAYNMVVSMAVWTLK